VNAVTAAVHIGPSGWNYAEWRPNFYAGVRQKQWLAYCGRQFTGIEVNATFYRFMRSELFQRWHDAVPADFAFAIKGHRQVTHLHRLVDTSSLAGQRAAALPLAEKLAVVLWQLPGNYHCDLARLEAFVSALADWPEPRHAIEFRHRSWFVDEVAARLERRRIAVCQSDSPEWPLWPCVTTDLVYVRLHGHTQLYASNYGERALVGWARRIEQWREEGRAVHVYFDNTASGNAPRNARRLLELLERRAGREACGGAGLPRLSTATASCRTMPEEEGGSCGQALDQPRNRLLRHRQGARVRREGGDR
jgi:uncharacterized protein YecE (DUF72 family)